MLTSETSTRSNLSNHQTHLLCLEVKKERLEVRTADIHCATWTLLNIAEQDARFPLHMGHVPPARQGRPETSDQKTRPSLDAIGMVLHC